jgi:hypothetical protein
MQTNNNIGSLINQMGHMNVSRHAPARKAAKKSTHKLANTKTRKSVKAAAVTKKKANKNITMGPSRTRKNKTAKPVNANAMKRENVYVEIEKLRDYFERKNRGEVVHRPVPPHVQNIIRSKFEQKMARILKNIEKQLHINEIIKSGYKQKLSSGKFTQTEYRQKMDHLEEGEVIFHTGKQLIEKTLSTPKNVDELSALFSKL